MESDDLSREKLSGSLVWPRQARSETNFG